MHHRFSLAIILLIAFCCLISCAQISKRTPGEYRRMHNFLTQDDPTKCRNYHYNFERQTPRLYGEHQQDSILDIIEYIKTECGPASNLEVVRLLLLAERGQFDDSLFGPSTIHQMLRYRNEHENLGEWGEWSFVYGFSEPIDNTHDNFNSFTTDLAKRVASDPGVRPTEQTLGLFYSGAFDSSFSRVQADDMRGSALRKSYDEFVARTKRKFSTRANFGLLVGSWRPQGNIHFLGNHPDIGLQYGQEQKRWRVDMVFNYRFTSAKNEYIVDSLGHLVSTDRFSSLLLGLDGGFKFIDNSRFSTDVFVGAGYEAMYSLQKAGDPEKSIIHSSLTASVGLRQRIFLDRRSGWYVGGIVRYGIVDYANSGGTDLSGQTMTISFVTGWCFHTTLKQFLRKLNYKGDWRS